MRVAAEITLSKEERRKLERWASARSTSVRLRERARIALMASEGMTNKAIAAVLGTDANKVGCWRSRVAKEGMSSIEKERPRGANHGGKDSNKQAELRSQVLEATTQSVPYRQRPPAGRVEGTHRPSHRCVRTVRCGPDTKRLLDSCAPIAADSRVHAAIGLPSSCSPSSPRSSAPPPASPDSCTSTSTATVGRRGSPGPPASPALA